MCGQRLSVAFNIRILKINVRAIMKTTDRIKCNKNQINTRIPVTFYYTSGVKIWVSFNYPLATKGALDEL